jgi:hypothetical protein
VSLGKKAVMVKYTKPRCAKCGSTRDLRSQTGPCGKCAFEKKACGDMLEYFQKHPEKLREKRLRDAKKKHAMAAFSDELQKIAASTSFMQNVGNKFVEWGKAIASTPRRTVQAVGDIVSSPSAALRHGWNETWGPNVGFGGKAMFLGGTALQAHDLTRENDITGRGESRVTRGSRLVGGTLAGMAGMTRGALPAMVLGIGGDVAGGYVGRKIDKLRGYAPKPKNTAPHEAAPSKAAIVQKTLES